MYRPSEADGAADFESIRGRRILMVKYGLFGTRDLDAAQLRLAAAIAAQDFARGILLARFPKMSSRGLRNAWEKNSALLRPDLADRLGLAAIAMDGDVLIPDGDLELRKITALAHEARTSTAPISKPTAAGPWSSKQFDVWMVLLDSWLRCEPPLTINEVLRRSGTSTVTVKGALDRLALHSELKRTTSRRAALVGFPRRSMDEILTLTDSLRSTIRLVDASGRTTTRDSLMKRIRSHAPSTVVIGGVYAAKHYMPTFDLEGTPRIDLSVYGYDTLDWLTRVDPALRPVRADERFAVLVIHNVQRPRIEVETSNMRFASPAETLLDLYDLRLTGQAEEFTSSLRRGDK